MNVLRVCPVSGCGELTTGGRCPQHRRADNQRRHAKQKANGTTSARWQRLVTAAKQRAGQRCERCGRAPADADPGSRLSGHLDPALAGVHQAADESSITILCLRCHGTIDAPRAQRGGATTRPPARRTPRHPRARNVQRS